MTNKVFIMYQENEEDPENELVKRAALQIQSIKNKYKRQQLHVQESQSLYSPIELGQNFRVWQQEFQHQQQQQVQQIMHQKETQRFHPPSADDSTAEPFINDDDLEDNNPTEISSPGGSEVYEEGHVSISGRLVDIMPEYPCLWNIHLRSYKDLNVKDQAWKELETKLKTQGL